MSNRVVSEEYCRKIYMRESITMEELSKWQQWYTEKGSPQELVDAVDKMFDKIDLGKILIGG